MVISNLSRICSQYYIYIYILIIHLPDCIHHQRTHQLVLFTISGSNKHHLYTIYPPSMVHLHSNPRKTMRYVQSPEMVVNLGQPVVHRFGLYIYILLVGGLEHDFYDFPYIGNNNPMRRSYFSDGLKPPTSLCYPSRFVFVK